MTDSNVQDKDDLATQDTEQLTTKQEVSEYENIASRLTMGCMTGGYSCNCPQRLFNKCRWRYFLDNSIMH